MTQPTGISDYCEKELLGFAGVEINLEQGVNDITDTLKNHEERNPGEEGGHNIGDHPQAGAGTLNQGHECFSLGKFTQVINITSDNKHENDKNDP
jgi:hypothetical protein